VPDLAADLTGSMLVAAAISRSVASAAVMHTAALPDRERRFGLSRPVRDPDIQRTASGLAAAVPARGRLHSARRKSDPTDDRALARRLALHVGPTLSLTAHKTDVVRTSRPITLAITIKMATRCALAGGENLALANTLGCGVRPDRCANSD